jgi:hypothetical protein
LAFAIGVVSLLLTLTGYASRRHRRRERYRSFKGWGMEWTTFDRDDRDQL